MLVSPMTATISSQDEHANVRAAWTQEAWTQAGIIREGGGYGLTGPGLLTHLLIGFVAFALSFTESLRSLIAKSTILLFYEDGALRTTPFAMFSK